jgi:three-Cys-motif partner protein
MNDFHDAKTPWAKIKHGILSNYLPLFVNKTSLFKKTIYLVDGFAGAGKYDDGQPGSALISATIAVNPRTEASRGLLHCINVEKDPAAFAKLEEVTNFCVKLGFVNNIKGEFEKKLPEILATIEGDTALFFIDPFGTEGATADTLELISKRKGITEILIRFDDTRVKRLLNYNKNDPDGQNSRAAKTEEKFRQRVRLLTGETGITAALLKHPQAGSILVESYIELVTQEYGLFDYGLAYPVVNPATRGHRYYLAHFCKHPDGYIYMASFMAKVQRTVEKLTAKKNEENLFGPSTEDPDLFDVMGIRDEMVKNHEEGKVNTIVKKLPEIFKKHAWYGQTFERRWIYAAIVNEFTWTVLLKESKKALQAAKASGLVAFEKDHDAADVTVHKTPPI